MPAAASPPREESFQAEVRRHLRRNYLAYLSHGLLGQTGMRLVNAPTFLPAYVAALTGSDLAGMKVGALTSRIPVWPSSPWVRCAR